MSAPRRKCRAAATAGACCARCCSSRAAAARSACSWKCGRRTRTAIALYHDEGFNEIGRRPRYYPAKDGREDALVMAIELFADE